MATAQNKNIDVKACQDIQGFQEHLKTLRAVDDSIILNLNSTIVTSSFQKDIEQNVNNCKRFHQQLVDAYASRDKLIKACIADAESKVQTLKAQMNKDESMNLKVQRELRREQTKMRMMQKETTVEQIIQDRSLKALQERCRTYMTNF